jgi:DNA-directed RNA polymerase specialized sigma24 family protein
MRSRPERWLNKITVHVGSHYRQRAQHRREQLTPNDGIDAHDPSPAAPERIAAEQERRQVWDLAYYYLDPDLRGVLVAHDLDGVPMKEIAEERGIPLSTAYKWRTRALTALEAAAREAGND